LREALRLLEQEGLVERRPRRGTIVTPLDADDVREIYSLRWALERLAIELVLPLEDPAVLDPLRVAIREMRGAAAAGDREALLEANMGFHLALCALPRHQRLLRAYESLIQQLRLCMAMNLHFREQLYGDPEDSVRRHERLLDLIEAGDVAAVHREIEAHGDRAFMARLDDFVGRSRGDSMA
jgi:DNA-binding GntR family transcriptional regulator